MSPREWCAWALFGLITRFRLQPVTGLWECAVHGPNTIRTVGVRARICCYCHDVEDR